MSINLFQRGDLFSVGKPENPRQVAKWRAPTGEMFTYCQENFGPRGERWDTERAAFALGYEYIVDFLAESDAMVFYMRFSGDDEK